MRFQSTGVLSFAWGEALIAGLLAFVALFIHETGHAVVGRMVGRKVLRLQFGLAGGAITSGDTTPLRRIAGLAAGPLAEIAFGALLLVASEGVPSNPLAIAGFVAILNGAGNLLPFHKATDGFKILRFARLALRGNQPLTCAAEGPCPACSADFPEAQIYSSNVIEFPQTSNTERKAA